MTSRNTGTAPKSELRRGVGAKQQSVKKGKTISLLVKLEATGEIFSIKNIHWDLSIQEFKGLAEFTTGIPCNMQRLQYLDQGDLQGLTDIKSNDIVAGATIVMKVWHTWNTLIEAVTSGDIEWLLQLGMTEDSGYRTPTSDYMNPRARHSWFAERSFTALYIAAHRGNMKVVNRLIDIGANVNGKTSLGRSPLHVAAARGHGKVLDRLLERGANINATDNMGDNALSIAAKFGHKGCERHLFLFRWQERAKDIDPVPEHEMFAHQYFDSSLKVWLNGPVARIYFQKIMPPGEFDGTGIDAPRRKVLSSREKRKQWWELEEQSHPQCSNGAISQKWKVSSRTAGDIGEGYLPGSPIEQEALDRKIKHDDPRDQQPTLMPAIREENASFRGRQKYQTGKEAETVKDTLFKEVGIRKPVKTRKSGLSGVDDITKQTLHKQRRSHSAKERSVNEVYLHSYKSGHRDILAKLL